MKKVILFPLLFAITLFTGTLALADPPAKPVPDRWRSIDETIKQAKLDLNALQKFYHKAQIMARAVQTFNPMKPLAEVEKETDRAYQQCLTTMTLTAMASVSDAPPCKGDCTGDSLSAYFACSTFAQGTDVCSAAGELMRLQSVTTPTNAEFCRLEVANMRFLKDYMAHGRPSMATCEQEIQLLLQDPGAAHQACQVIVQALPVDAACEKLVPIMKRSHLGEQGHEGDRFKVDEGWCRVELNTLMGTQDCSTLNSQAAPGIDWMCDLSKSFRRAFEARSPNQCGNSGMCRVMMTGDIKACNVYVTDLRKRLCSAMLKRRQKEDIIKIAQMKVLITGGGGFPLLSDDQIQTLRPDIDDALARGYAGGTAQARAINELSKLAQGQKPANATLRMILMDIAGLKQAAVKAQIDQAQGLLDGTDKTGSDYEERRSSVVDVRDKFQAMALPDLSEIK